jgi:hypothetical protein
LTQSLSNPPTLPPFRPTLAAELYIANTPLLITALNHYITHCSTRASATTFDWAKEALHTERLNAELLKTNLLSALASRPNQPSDAEAYLQSYWGPES